MVVLSRTPMSTELPLLVGAGSVPEQRMRDAAEALAQHWTVPLATHPIGTSPATVLNEPWPGFVRLSGDPARQRPDGGHWLEAIADWRQPMLLLVPGEADGSVSGHAAAYSALCGQLGAPLLGLIQIQGSWDPRQRRRDGLTWLGWIPAHADSAHAMELERLSICLQRAGVPQTQKTQVLRTEARAAATAQA